MRTKLTIAAAALGVAALIGGAAWACVPGAGITLAPPSGGPGTALTVSGTTFDSQGSLVNIYWDGTSGTLVGQAQVQPDRTFNFSFTVPGNASGGSHVVSATQLDRNGLAYNPVNRAFSVSGPRRANAPNQQGAAVPEQPDGVTTAAPAPQPAAQTAPRAAAAVPAQASGPAPPGPGAPGPAVGTQAGPQAPPPAAAAEQQGAAAQQPAGSQEAFRTPVPAPAPAPAGAGEAVSSSGGPSPWLLVPLAILSLGFLGAGSGIFLRERKRTRVTA